MTPRMALLLAWIVVGAAVLVAHAVALVQVLRSPVGWRWKALALFPPATPFVAWGAGRRVAPLAWGFFALLYLVLRLLEGAL